MAILVDETVLIFRFFFKDYSMKRTHKKKKSVTFHYGIHMYIHNGIGIKWKKIF